MSRRPTRWTGEACRVVFEAWQESGISRRALADDRATPQSIDGPASTASAPRNGVPPGLQLTPSDERLITQDMARFGYWREKAIKRLILFGGI